MVSKLCIIAKRSFAISFSLLCILLILIPASASSINTSAPYFNYTRSGVTFALGGSQDWSDAPYTINRTDNGFYMFDTIPFAEEVIMQFPFYGASVMPKMTFSYPCEVSVSYTLNGINVIPITKNFDNVTSLDLLSIDFSIVDYVSNLMIYIYPSYEDNTDPNVLQGIWLLNDTVSGTMFTTNVSYTYNVSGTCDAVGDIEESIAFDRLRFYRNTAGLYVTADDTDSGLSWDIVIANESQINAPIVITSGQDVTLLSFFQTNATKQGAPQTVDISLTLPVRSRTMTSIASTYRSRINSLQDQLDNANDIISDGFNPFQWLINGVDVFLNTDLGFGITLGGLVGIVFAFAIVFILLRLWGGG